VMGVVYDPIRDELFAASRGSGAWLNGKKLHVSAVNDLSQSLLATGFPYDIRVSHDNNINFFSAMVKRRRRSGARVLRPSIWPTWRPDEWMVSGN